MARRPLARLTVALALVSVFGLAASQDQCHGNAPASGETGVTGLAKAVLETGALLREVQGAVCRLYVLTDNGRDLPRFCPRPPTACELPIEPGPCRAAIPRWGFDSTSGRCEEFVYGGCGGNANNFETREACEQRCGEAPATCKLPPERGPCQAALPRWYFDDARGRCAEFAYGGCGGNANNFASEEACRRACGGEPVPVCELPAERGPCLATLPRWHFDGKSGQCEPFVYGGCGGNPNNFETREACERSCSVPDACDLPADAGPCDAAIPRFFHDPATNRCEPFVWGGCGGNPNKFSSLAECESACPSCRPELCLPHQECRLYTSPSGVPGTKPRPEVYCADTCDGFPCPEGQHCALQQVQCIRAPCPPIARCVDHDACATVRCAAPSVCQVDPATGRPSCVAPVK